ncbi:MAG: AAA family ATPase [Desulfobacterales bacterium]|nr:AAA family ATPase [Desulfobacterales bacterium]
MIVGISIKNFKSIRQVKGLPLNRFHVLVGPNASGKSTFLDVFDFIRDCLEKKPLAAVESRVPEFDDLTWLRKGGTISFEIWFDMGHLIEHQKDNIYNYHLAISKDPELGVRIHEELLRRYSKTWMVPGRHFEFSEKAKPRKMLGKTAKGTDFYQGETSKYQDSFVFGMDKSTLSLTPPDEDRYPSANVIRRFLMQSIRYIQLNSEMMRTPCPATRPLELELDGANIARVAGRLLSDNEKYKEAVTRWIGHLRYALPELKEIGWNKRQPDNAEYLVLKYDNGFECPAWLVSDGTLRILALTLLAFLPPSSGMFMIEEPENGVHPKALEIILRSLSTVPNAQMLIATHSPFVVQQAGCKSLLYFSKEAEQTIITPGPEHPLLKEWDGTPDLATVFASGVLG